MCWQAYHSLFSRCDMKFVSLESSTACDEDIKHRKSRCHHCISSDSTAQSRRLVECLRLKTLETFETATSMDDLSRVSHKSSEARPWLESAIARSSSSRLHWRTITKPHLHHVGSHWIVHCSHTVTFLHALTSRSPRSPYHHSLRIPLLKETYCHNVKYTGPAALASWRQSMHQHNPRQHG